MAITVKQVVGKFLNSERGINQTRAFEFFNQVHQEILTRAQVRNVVSTITLTAGTRLYDLTTDLTQIHEAYYQRTSDPASWVQLEETSTDHLATFARGWRATNAEGIPYRYYITSAVDGLSAKPQVGFDPVPASSSDPTFPRVALYATRCADLAESDTIPSNLLGDFVYLEGMRYYAAVEKKDMEGAAFHMESYQRELDRNVIHVKSLLKQLTTDFAPIMNLTGTSIV